MEILYIEDDHIDQLILKRILRRKEGINYQIANNLQEAKQLVKAHTFDVILSDYHLAADTIEDILEVFIDLPIFLISGSDHHQKIQQLYDRGLKGHFQKPFIVEYLQQIIDKERVEYPKKAAKKMADFRLPITFDFEYLDKMSAKSPAVKYEFIQIFVDMGAKDSLQLVNAFHIQNWQLVQHFTHKFKSNFNMMGLKQLYLKAEELEFDFLKGDDRGFITQEFPHFLDRLADAIEMAKLYLDKQREGVRCR